MWPTSLDEISFVNAKGFIEVTQMGKGGLTHPYDADSLGFHQGDLNALAGQNRYHRCRSHPSSGATADDDDTPRGILTQSSLPGVQLMRGIFAFSL